MAGIIEGDQGEAGGTDFPKGNSVPGLSPSMIPPLRYIHKEFQYKLPADFEFLNSRIRTRQNQAEYLKYRCQNRTGAAIVKIEFSKLSEFPEAADPPVDRSYSILESCKIL